MKSELFQTALSPTQRIKVALSRSTALALTSVHSQEAGWPTALVELAVFFDLLCSPPSGVLSNLQLGGLTLSLLHVSLLVSVLVL
jgi:hypothetical protein